MLGRDPFRCATDEGVVIRHETVTLVLVLPASGRYTPLSFQVVPPSLKLRNTKIYERLVPLSMTLRNWYPYAIAACFTLSLMSVAAVAQTGETRQRQIAPTDQALNQVALTDDPVVLSVASPADLKAASLTTPTLASAKFQTLMLAAIDQRLGARYSWGATGPSAFDCSGFVWSTFQSIGINFERSSARTLWSRFAPATPEEEVKFGTLVFFSNLRHIGIVADANGFYHASRHHGVVYSPFNDYWLSRIDGFRRVPLPAVPAAD